MLSAAWWLPAAAPASRGAHPLVLLVLVILHATQLQPATVHRGGCMGGGAARSRVRAGEGGSSGDGSAAAAVTARGRLVGSLDALVLDSKYYFNAQYTSCKANNSPTHPLNGQPLT